MVVCLQTTTVAYLLARTSLGLLRIPPPPPPPPEPHTCKHTAQCRPHQLLTRGNTLLLPWCLMGMQQRCQCRFLCLHKLRQTYSSSRNGVSSSSGSSSSGNSKVGINSSIGMDGNNGSNCLLRLLLPVVVVTSIILPFCRPLGKGQLDVTNQALPQASFPGCN